MRRLAELARRALALVLGLALGLLASELGLRAVWHPPLLRSTLAFVGHPVYGGAPIPGAEGVIAKMEYEHRFHHTRQGLRGARELARERPPGVRRRVLFLGDSFTYGLGSEDDETFVARLAAAWPEDEVANAGCNGYGTREELAVLDLLGGAFRPDLTVLVFFWNDLEDNVKRDSIRFERDAKGAVRRTAPAAQIDPLALQPPQESVPVQLGRSRLRMFVKDGLKGLRYRYLGIRERAIRTEEQKEAAWRVAERLLALARDEAAALGTELVVVSLPDHNQVDPEAVIKNIEPLNFEVQDRLREVCAELGLTLFDLLPGMRREHERRPRPLYYYADRHLTPEGNRVVAELLRPALERLGVPGDLER